MVRSFLITLREGIEAALVVGLVLAAVQKTSALGMMRFVWYGVGAAVAMSALVGRRLPI